MRLRQAAENEDVVGPVLKIDPYCPVFNITLGPSAAALLQTSLMRLVSQQFVQMLVHQARIGILNDSLAAYDVVMWHIFIYVPCLLDRLGAPRSSWGAFHSVVMNAFQRNSILHTLDDVTHIKEVVVKNTFLGCHDVSDLGSLCCDRLVWNWPGWLIGIIEQSTDQLLWAYLFHLVDSVWLLINYVSDNYFNNFV